MEERPASASRRQRRAGQKGSECRGFSNGACVLVRQEALATYPFMQEKQKGEIEKEKKSRGKRVEKSKAKLTGRM